MATDRLQLIRGIVAVVAIAAAIVVIVAFRRTRVDASARPRPIVTIDVATGLVVEVVKKPGEFYPLTNPRTGARTLYMAYVCRNEKTLFPGQGMVMQCPHCGSSDIGGVNPDETVVRAYPVNTASFQP